MRKVLTAILIHLLWISAPNAQQANWLSLISESRGQMGVFRLGGHINEYASYLRPLPPGVAVPGTIDARGFADRNVFITRDSQIELVVDARTGTIVELITGSSAMFTEQFLRPGVSTVNDVLSRYAGIQSAEDRAGHLVFSYGALSFWVANANRSTPINALVARRISSISLRLAPASGAPVQQAPLRSGTANGCVTPGFTCPVRPQTVAVGETCSCPGSSGPVWGVGR